jgi:hypothetical protein
MKHAYRTLKIQEERVVISDLNYLKGMFQNNIVEGGIVNVEIGGINVGINIGTNVGTINQIAVITPSFSSQMDQILADLNASLGQGNNL